MVDKLRLEVLLAAVDKVTGPLRAVAAGSKTTAKAVGETEAALKRLQAQQRTLARFEKERDQLDNARSMLDQAKAANASRTVVRQLTVDYEKQLAVVKRLQADMANRGWGDARVDQQQLASAIMTANTQLDAQRRKMEQQRQVEERLAGLREKHDKQMRRLAMWGATAAAGVHVGRRMMQTGLAPVGSFMQHEDAMMGVARQVQGARDADGNLTQVYRDAEKQVRDLSTRLPQTTVQIAQMMTAAARMEVPTKELGAFVELTSEMATAFDSVPDEIAESMGKIAKNLKMPITEIRGMADAINYLDDNAISKGADIIGFMNRVSGVTGTVGISGRNMAALGSTLLTSGETEETSGTAIKAIFTNFAAATKGPKRFQSALREIGITAEHMQAGMAKDAVGMLMQVADAINKLPEKDRLGVMAELAGKEHVGRLAKLVTNTEELRRQIELANGAEAQGSMAREAAARNSALSAQLLMQQNRAFNAMAAAGENLKAPLLELFKAVNPLLERFTAWMQANPVLVGGLLKAVVVLGALTAGVSAVGLAIVAALGPMTLARFLLGRWMLKLAAARIAAQAAAPAMGLLYRAGFMLGRALTFLRAGAGLLLGGLRVLAAFLIANPIVLAIGLLAAAGYMLYSRWQDVVGGFKLLMQDIGGAVSGAAQYVWGLGARFFEAGAAIVQGMANGITSRITAVRDAISMAAGDAIDWFKNKLGIHSPSRVFMQLGSYVGEGAALGIQNGASMVRTAALGMATASMVPMAAMGAPAAAGTPPAVGSTYSITINAAPGMDAQAIARAVAAELDRRERAADSRRYSRLADID